MWIVDTCVIVDVLQNDPRFGRASALLVQKLAPQGLAACPVTMVELAAEFDGNLATQKTFLLKIEIGFSEAWHTADTELAQAAWHAFVSARRNGKTPRRPIADILIGAFAMNRGGLITRNPDDFRRWFPKLAIKEP
jgi:predicted nucleic acid-binding protein